MVLTLQRGGTRMTPPTEGSSPPTVAVAVAAAAAAAAARLEATRRVVTGRARRR